jgi:dimethylhistidine N-methyltransferase
VSISVVSSAPSLHDFRREVLQGLRDCPKHLPCKYFYDRRGAALFDRICQLGEYYLTRTELSIMRRHATSIAGRIGTESMLIEYGSGNSTKTQLILDHIGLPAAYVPVDMALGSLMQSAESLVARYPDLEVLPVCADFSELFEIPETSFEPARRVVYFPGSTIGNFEPRAASTLLSQIRGRCGAQGGAIIGIDLQKEKRLIESAYNDRQHVTDEFNLNLLRRINRELGADFELARFRHRAVYNEFAGRVESYLVSQSQQVVTIGGEAFPFARGEPVCTEYSYKYTLDGFARLAEEAGLSLADSWIDNHGWFAVVYLIRRA